ncbi:MAG: DUF5615 family PIN-like protein [Bacteroidota bacterium]
MKVLLIDMNLSPSWVTFLADHQIESTHWSTIGAANAPDHEIMAYAKRENYIVFTHDLDFGTILAATNADAPSVIQLRTKDVSPEAMGELVCQTIKKYTPNLETGCLLTIDLYHSRVRILPIRPS